VRNGPDGDRDVEEHFLVDGVAPPVIGGGPPESSFDQEPEYDAPDRHGQPPRRAPDPVSTHREPPTSPIPVIRSVPSGEQRAKRRSWVARVLRLPGS
jgi:hypothetical protein